jgi:hypothetical protein
VTEAVHDHRGSTEAAVEDAPAASRLSRVRELQSAYGNRAFGRLVQAVARSAQSDKIDALKPEVPLDTLMAALKGMTRPDADVEASLATKLAARSDDLWLALRVFRGEIGRTGKKRSIEAHYFPGTSGRRALVIGGVHGTERQGMEVARLLQSDLATQPAAFSVVLVPVLFPDNAAKGKLGERETVTDTGRTIETNRNFPTPDKDLAASGGKNAKGGDILPENQLLMELMERFRPERIISLHGTWDSSLAGVFYDPRKLTAAERKAAEDEAAAAAATSSRPRATDGEGASEARWREVYEKSLAQGLKVRADQADAADRDLSLRAAKLIDERTAAIDGRDRRSMSAPNAAQLEGKKKHSSVAGNVGQSGDLDFAFWGGGVPGGVSLGGYASARGMSIFTVEPPINRNIADYGAGSTAGDKVSQTGRRTELQAYADAVRTVLLAA